MSEGLRAMELFPPPGTSGFDLALAVVKVLEREHHAVVADVDIGPDGLQFGLRIVAGQPKWIQTGWRRDLLIRRTRERALVTTEQCDTIRDTVARQRAEIIRRRDWIQAAIARHRLAPAC